jgi:tRNA-Thr(GGU) m(6)t(6)A37 methyltransferase TsaA
MNGLSLSAIGRLRTPFATLADCPRNGRQGQPPLCHAELFAPFRDGLLGLEGFSHLFALYWLDRAPPPSMVVVPPFHGAPRGVFATRAPCRPNPIGLSVVAFEGMDADGRLRLRYLDCVDGTPLLDLKPYLSSTDSEPKAMMGWLAPYATEKR